MRRPLLATLLLAPGLAWAQSYQTALPLDGAERLAAETRLSTILDFARTGEVNRFELPSGRTMSVRTYRPVERSGEPPCRGYRIDLEGGGGSIAVDGFRCRRDNGAWLIVEPEIVLTQQGPLDLRGATLVPGDDELEATTPRDSLGIPLDERFDTPPGDAGEPLYPSDNAGVFGEPAASPPVPRPAPRGELAAASPRAPQGADFDPFRPREPAEAGRRDYDLIPPPQPEPDVAAAEPEAPQDISPEPEPDLAAAEPEAPRDDTPEPDFATLELEDLESVPEPEEPAGTTTLARAPDPAPAVEPQDTPQPRIVGDVAPPVREATPTAAQDEPDYASDTRVVARLRDLDYLDPDAEPTPEAVQRAVDEFARDEEFALPVSPDALADRLGAAQERSAGLTPCGGGSTALCVVR